MDSSVGMALMVLGGLLIVAAIVLSTRPFGLFRGKAVELDGLAEDDESAEAALETSTTISAPMPSLVEKPSAQAGADVAWAAPPPVAALAVEEVVAESPFAVVEEDEESATPLVAEHSSVKFESPVVVAPAPAVSAFTAPVFEMPAELASALAELKALPGLMALPGLEMPAPPVVEQLPLNIEAPMVLTSVSSDHAVESSLSDEALGEIHGELFTLRDMIAGLGEDLKSLRMHFEGTPGAERPVSIGPATTEELRRIA